MIVTTKIMKNMKVRTKIRMLVGLAIAVIVLFTLQIVSISEKISTYVGLSAEELDKKANAIVTQGIITGIVFEVMIIGLGVYVARAIGINLKKIVGAIKIVSDGGIEVAIEKDSNDEFGEIIDAINEMVDSVKHDARIAYNISEGDLSMDITPRTDIDVLGMAFKKLVDLDFSQIHLYRNILELLTINSAVNIPCEVKTIAPSSLTILRYCCHSSPNGITLSHLFWVVP